MTVAFKSTMIDLFSWSLSSSFVYKPLFSAWRRSTSSWVEVSLSRILSTRVREAFSAAFFRCYSALIASSYCLTMDLNLPFSSSRVLFCS